MMGNHCSKMKRPTSETSRAEAPMWCNSHVAPLNMLFHEHHNQDSSDTWSWSLHRPMTKNHPLLEQLLSYTDLMTFVQQHGPLSEHQGHTIITQLIHILSQHKQQSTFLEPLCLHHIFVNPSTLQIKVIQFHHMNFFCNHKYKTLLSSSSLYWPAEYNQKQYYYADAMLTWTLGIILYFLFYAKMPFMSPFESVFRPVILSYRKELSMDAKLFIAWCLAKNPLERITLHQCSFHPWITKKYI